MKELTSSHGYSPDMKEYKNNPDKYKGSIADISNIIRVSVTKKSQLEILKNWIEMLRIIEKSL